MKRKILFILFCICSFSSMVASKRTGAQDRELWVFFSRKADTTITIIL